MSTAASPDPMRPDAALLAEIDRDLGALARARRWRTAIFIVSAGAIVGGVGTRLGMHDGHFIGAGCGEPLHGVFMGAFAAIGLALVALAFGLMLPRGQVVRPAPIVGAFAALAVLSGMAAAFESPAGALWHGVACLGTGLFASTLLLIAALAAGRRVMRRHAPSGLLFGVGIGTLSLIPLSLACHDASLPHLMIWHGAIPLVAGGLAALVWRFARPR
ncbi:MAG: hypothetical protein KC620_09620 [Myxococcales bacterium]|nr:hypothetical protein [Myxococcales bacterium]